MNEQLERVVTEGLDDVGFDLVELRQGGTRSRPVLEVRIDRRDGEKVTVDDCARASRAVEARLDGGDLVNDRYVLQVSSPGERPLRTPAEWRRFVGRWASVLAPDFGGRLEGEIMDVAPVDGVAGEAAVLLRPEGKEATRIPLAAIREARLAFRFS
jgi:ribosome maturation factor RimP